MKVPSLSPVAAGAALLALCGLDAFIASLDRPSGRAANPPSLRTGAPSEPPATADVNAAPAPAPFAAGMRFDPGTGERGAREDGIQRELTIDELQDLAREEAEGLVTVRHPDGSESIEHEGRFMDVLVMRTGPDGKPVFACAHGAYGVHDILRKNRPVRPALEEE